MDQSRPALSLLSQWQVLSEVHMESIQDINLLFLYYSLNQTAKEKIDLKKWLGNSFSELDKENE
jgi:hypothetical protein